MHRQIVVPFLYYFFGYTDARHVILDHKRHHGFLVNILETDPQRRASVLEDRHKRVGAVKDWIADADEFNSGAASSSRCAVSDNGSYGLPTPESATLEVKYYYEMEYAPEAESEEELLSAVEKSIGSKIVGVFFKECRARRLVAESDVFIKNINNERTRRLGDNRTVPNNDTSVTSDERTTSNNDETLEVKERHILENHDEDHHIIENQIESLSENITSSPRNDTVSREDQLSKYANRTKDASPSLVEALETQPSLIVEGVTCQSFMEDEANSCAVIESITYVHYNKEKPSDAVERVVLAALDVIEFLMNSGFFDHGVHEDIRKVTFIGTTLPIYYEEPIYVSDTLVPEDSDDEPVYYAIIASSCLVVLAAIMSVSAIIVTKMKEGGEEDELYNETDIEKDDSNASGNDLCEDVIPPTEHGITEHGTTEHGTAKHGTIEHGFSAWSITNDGNANIDYVTDDSDETPRVATEDRESTNYKSTPPIAENLDESQIITELNECRKSSQNVQ